MRQEVPTELIPDEYKIMPGRDVPFDMLPDGYKPAKIITSKFKPEIPKPFGTQRVQIPQATTQLQKATEEEGLPAMIGKSVMGGFGAIGTGLAGVVKAGLETVGIEDPGIAEMEQIVTDYWAPKVGESTAKKYVSAIIRSTAQSVPTMLTGPLALPLFGLTSAGNKYIQLRDAGQSIKTSLAASIPVGISEAITEKLPLGVLMKQGTPIVKRLLKATALEIPGEQINTIVESVVDKFTIRPGLTLKEYLNDVIDTAVVTIGQTLLTGGLVHGLVKGEKVVKPREVAKPEPAPKIAEPELAKPTIKGQEVPLEMVPIELTEVVPEVKPIEQPKLEVAKPEVSRETAKYLELDQEFIDLRNRAIKGETLSDTDLKRYEDLRIEVPYWMEKAGISGKEIPPEAKVEGVKQPWEMTKTEYLASGTDIDTSGAMYKFFPEPTKKIKKGEYQQAKLGDILDFPELYERYPELKDFKVVKKDLGEDTFAIHAPGEIWINEKETYKLFPNATPEQIASLKAKDAKKNLNNLLHEIQHEIQFGEREYKDLRKLPEKTFEEYYKKPTEVEARDIEKFLRVTPTIEGHKTKIFKAISEDKTIPPEVLADYPDLQAAPPRVETVTAPSEARVAEKVVEPERVIEPTKVEPEVVAEIPKTEIIPEEITKKEHFTYTQDVPEGINPDVWEKAQDLAGVDGIDVYDIGGRKIVQSHAEFSFNSKTWDGKTGEEVGDIWKIQSEYENKLRFQRRQAELALIPDVKPKMVVPPTKGAINTAKAQKTYLIDAIDEAIKEAPETVEAVRTGFPGQVGADIAIEKTPHVLIEVPGDGVFRIVNSKEALEGFKKLAEARFPGGPVRVSPEAIRKPSEKPTGRRISPKDNSEYEYVAEYSPKKVIDADYEISKGDKVFVGEGWFTNGHFAVKGTAPLVFNKGTIQPFTKEMLKKVMPSEKGMARADYIAEFHLMGNPLNGGMAVNKNAEALFNPAYMDIIKKYHPDSTILFKDDTSPMLFKKGKETIGILMPMRLDVGLEPVREFLRSEGVKLPEEVVEEPIPEKTISQFTEEYKKDLGEGGFIRVGGVEKPTPKVVTPGTKDLSLPEFGLTTLHVADRHPFIAPIIKGNIKAEQNTNNWILRYSDRFSEAFDKVEKPGIWMKVFGRKGTNIRDVDLMAEKKVQIPKELEGFVDDVGVALSDIKSEIIQKMKDDFAKSLSSIQRKYLDWEVGGRVGEELKTTVAEYTYTNKKGQVITVPEHTRPVPKATKQAVGEALKQFEEMEKWGFIDYFPHIFKGKYKYLTEDGHIIASGQTAKQAKANFVEYVESHPETTEQTFMFVNDFYDLLTVRKVLNPELTNPLEYLGTRLSRKEFFHLLGRTEKVIKEEIANAGVDDIPKVKVDMSGIASFQKGKKFSGHFLKRKTSLRGEETDPFKALMSYVFSVGRKLGLEDAKIASYSFADSLPKNMPNAKSYIKMQADNMSGRYNIIDKIFDETIGEKLGMKPFGVTRIFAKGVGLESKLKLGYAPAKTAVNRMGGVFHIILQEGGKNYYEGRKLLKLKDPDLMGRIEREGHLAGMEQLFAGEGLLGVSKKQTSWWRPLGTYQMAEVKSRSEALAAAYVSGLKKFGGDKDAAWIYALDSAQLTQFLYNTAAKPVLVRGPILQAMYQFKQFTASEMRFMSQLTPAQWAGYIPGMVALAGTKGALLTIKSIIGISVIGLGIDELMERLNRKAPRLHRGIFGLVGVDVSAPASWQIPSSVKDWIGVFPRDVIETGEMIIKGLKNNGWTDEQINDYVRQITPVGYNIFKGLQMLSEGVTKEGTKVIYRGGKAEGVINFAGAKSVSQSQASDSARYMNQQRKLLVDKIKVVEDRLFGSKSQEEAENTFKELVELKNIQTPEEMKYLINGLVQSAKSRVLTEEARIFMTLPITLKKEEIRRR